MSESSGTDILAARARALARPLDAFGALAGPAQRDGAAASVLVVRIAGDRTGIALDHIIEVHRAGEITPIPAARAPVVGVIAWRGRVLTVLDIAADRRDPITVGDTTRILVLGHRRAVFGVVADDVEDVDDVNVNDATLVTDIAPARRALVRGVTADAVVVLDTAALIARFAPLH